MTTETPRCDVHNDHSPRPLLFEQHHILPLGMGGADVAINKVWVCAGGHYNIHVLLADLIRSAASGEPRMRRAGSRVERRYAMQGFTSWVEAGKPGRPVYEARPV